MAVCRPSQSRLRRASSPGGRAFGKMINFVAFCGVRETMNLPRAPTSGELLSVAKLRGLAERSKAKAFCLAQP